MFSLGKILLPVDFSERCLQARHAVPSLTKRFDSEVTVLHVLSPYFGFRLAEMGSVLSSDLMTRTFPTDPFGSTSASSDTVPWSFALMASGVYTGFTSRVSTGGWIPVPHDCGLLGEASTASA